MKQSLNYSAVHKNIMRDRAVRSVTEHREELLKGKKP